MLFLFFLIDFFILSLLPKLRISFGPPQPQSFLLALLRIPFNWLPIPFNWILQITGTLLVIIGFVLEPSRITITKKELAANFTTHQKTKFIHLGDIHLEEIGKREEKLLSKLKESKPDFILFTGDFLNLSYRSDPEAIKTVADFFNTIYQIAPTYWVTGSPAVDLEDSIQQISEQTQAAWLNDSARLIHQNLELIGINCSHQPHADLQKLMNIRRTEADVFSILLYHSPDLVFELIDQKINLMLSGHTHGGQVRLPLIGALFTGSLYGRKLQMGEYQFYNTILYITRGIGLEGLGAPRVRFLSPPEIIEWTIHH